MHTSCKSCIYEQVAVVLVVLVAVMVTVAIAAATWDVVRALDFEQHTNGMNEVCVKIFLWKKSQVVLMVFVGFSFFCIFKEGYMKSSQFCCNSVLHEF